ncbi:MAG: hypothetical protein F6K63_06275 [Moorea sp. SIO1G6]|uniref:Uncharacterized protein n=1 Tax=Moorena producens (strain JHB) TaxID=1454205 RepID=A0A1D9G7D7_MOOP1|nr:MULTISPECIES: hypothetical protein [Moorena]AOY83559.2 hypothetical protein BJP36_30215 [Moorena producens JHB]NET64030.1 hypothetical protein [Moorena sp. SIO1G6]
MPVPPTGSNSFDQMHPIKPMLTCCLDAVAHGGNHGSCSWGKPPLAALPPQDRAASLIQKLTADG